MRKKAKLYNGILETVSSNVSIGLKRDIEWAETLNNWLILNIPKFLPVKVTIIYNHLINKSNPINI